LFQYQTNICFYLKHLLRLPNEKPTQFASTIKNRTSRNTTKVFNRACKADPKEKLFFKKFPKLQKRIKNATHNHDTETQYCQWFAETDDRTPAGNRRLAQRRVTWLIEHSTPHQLLWCIDSFVLRNPPLPQAPKRCALLNDYTQ
jgi:hypothetical protein